MNNVQNIFKKYTPEYLNKFSNNIPKQHRKVIDAITTCMTYENGTNTFICPNCKKIHINFRSCGNRHCPTCQNNKALIWMKKQSEKLLPVPYFMITFTIPESLRSFIRSNQRLGYNSMFKAAIYSLKKLAKDQKFIGANTIGGFSILHTWGRILQYHPHIHFLIPSGGISENGKVWKSSHAHFFLPVKALSKIYKAKFKSIIASKNILNNISQDVWINPWNIHCKNVGNGYSSIKYLAPYLFKVAIANSRVIKFDDNKVTFKYQKVGSKKIKLITINALEFIRRFLTHVLPNGFRKVRHFGFLCHNCNFSIEFIKNLIQNIFLDKFDYIEILEKIIIKKYGCSNCKTPLIFVKFTQYDYLLNTS